MIHVHLYWCYTYDEKSIVDNHFYHIITVTMCAVGIKENQEKLPTLYWLPKLHNRPYEARFIANSSPCTTTELSKLLLNYCPLLLSETYN